MPTFISLLIVVDNFISVRWFFSLVRSFETWNRKRRGAFAWRELHSTYPYKINSDYFTSKWNFSLDFIFTFDGGFSLEICSSIICHQNVFVLFIFEQVTHERIKLKLLMVKCNRLSFDLRCQMNEIGLILWLYAISLFKLATIKIVIIFIKNEHSALDPLSCLAWEAIS